MNVEKYIPEKHNDMLKLWYKQWNLPIDQIEILPNTGMVIDNICALFLYETNSSVCFLENFVSNKFIDEDIRQKGFYLICLAMEEWVKFLGYKQVITTSNNSEVIKRCLDMNFIKSEKQYYVLTRRM